MALEGLEPARVFYFFETITRIPRKSGCEGAVSSWLLDLAAQHGWQAERDDACNVRFLIPASPGLEHAPGLILQAHMDMVCAKEPGSSFDFSSQQIPVYQEDGFVRARGTSLGADDGIGVALILALLEGLTETGAPHPPLRALFTAGEETMLAGAQALDPAWLDCGWLVGLDYSSNDAILVSCAGISLLRTSLPVQRTPLDGSYALFSLSLTGLLGGHSAKAIHLGRGNAIRLLAEVCAVLTRTYGCNLMNLGGGTALNAIPDAASAHLICPIAAAPRVQAAVKCIAAELYDRWHEQEPGLRLDWTRGELASPSPLAEDTVGSLLNFVTGLTIGAFTMAEIGPPRAESSANLGTLRADGNTFSAEISTRSNTEVLHDALLALHRGLATRWGWSAELVSRSGAWEYQRDSQLLELVSDAFFAVHGVHPPLEQIHAGVEGGIFQQKAASRSHRLQVVNVGCTTLDVHTPRERLKIDTVGKCFRLLQMLLQQTAHIDYVNTT